MKNNYGVAKMIGGRKIEEIGGSSKACIYKVSLGISY
jgi:hypothetical protein